MYQPVLPEGSSLLGLLVGVLGSPEVARELAATGCSTAGNRAARAPRTLRVVTEPSWLVRSSTVRLGVLLDTPEPSEPLAVSCLSDLVWCGVDLVNASREREHCSQQSSS